MKVCFRCKEEKSYDFYFRHHQTSDGYHSWCKKCCNDGNEKSRAKVLSTINGRARIFLQNAKKSARKRGHEFELTEQDVIDCWNEQFKICAYTGREMTLEPNKLNTVSIERIDNKIGYTKENTILVCRAINAMKSNFDFYDFYDLCKDVVEMLGDSNINLAYEAKK